MILEAGVLFAIKDTSCKITDVMHFYTIVLSKARKIIPASVVLLQQYYKGDVASCLTPNV
jgi:hypothetical protein